MSMFQDVGLFHDKFNLPTAHPGAKYRRPQLLGAMEFDYRVDFLKEELLEFMKAHMNGDLEGAADGLLDLIWVALGTGHMMGLPMDELWAEVRRANLEKRPWEPGDLVKPRAVHLGDDMSLEIAKPADWKPPQLMKIIEEAM